MRKKPAKIDFEETERKDILKEKEEEINRQKKIMECIEENEIFKKNKEKQIAYEAQKEKDEYEKMKIKREKEEEKEKEKQRKKIKIMMENGVYVHNQMKEREEKDKIGLKEKLEERRKIKQDIVIKSNFDNIRNKFSFYDQRKIAMTQFFRKEKELMSEYNPRKISVIELREMITGKRGRKSINAKEEFVGSSEIENEIMLSNNENIEENSLNDNKEIVEV